MLTDQPIFKFASVICQGNTKEARQCGSGGQRRRHCCCTVGLQYHYTERRQEQSSHYAPPPPQFTVGSTLDSKGSNDGHGGARLPQVFCINCSLFIGLNYKLLGRGGHCVMEQRDWWWVLVTAESLEVSSHLHIHETGILGGSDAAGFFCCRTVKATIDLKQQFPNRITLNMTPKYRLGFCFVPVIPRNPNNDPSSLTVNLYHISSWQGQIL